MEIVKIKKLVVVFVISTFCFCSCNSNTENKSNKESSDSLQKDTSSEALQLNGGQKWKVHDSMIVHIRIIETLVSTFDDTTIVEHKKLSDSVSTLMDLLTSNCVMTGPAHDELHKWLLPFIELNEAYGNCKNFKESDSLLQVMRKEFEVFNVYFE